MKNKKKLTLLTRNDLTGWLFVLPFVLGFIFFFLIPMFESIKYTVNKVTVTETGLAFEPIGWENYRFIFKEDTTYLKNIINTVKNFPVKALVIMFVSVFLAILLNDKFTGRVLFRAILFLPVIFAADDVMHIFNNMEYNSSNVLVESESSYFVMSNELSGFVNEVISSFGFLAEYIKKFTSYVNSIFNLLWDMGIQIILFIIGLNAIPSHLYEVAKIEGATKWETFWKITFPLLTPSMLLCLIFTAVDYFGDTKTWLYRKMANELSMRYDYGCTLFWVYSVALFFLVMVIYFVLSKKTVKLD